MYKIILFFITALSLEASIVGGIAITVEDKPITTYDIKQEMMLLHANEKKATNILIRKKLEELEIEKRHITISSSEVYDELKRMAARNKMSLSDFYKAVRESNGLTSKQLKQKVKEELLSKKLYSAIAYSEIDEPTDEELKEYYEVHKNKFSHPNAFKVIAYTSASKSQLQKKIQNPMFYSPNIRSKNLELQYSKIAPELANFLSQTKIRTFTPIMPNAQGEYVSFYIVEKIDPQTVEFQKVKNQVFNLVIEEKKEAVLGSFFTRLRQNTHINFIRSINDVEW